jgi:pimeloyl-ACP methyl ester carboxylesterase
MEHNRVEIDMKSKRIFKILLSIFLLLGVIFICLLIIMRPHTPAIKDDRGRIFPGSIATLEKIELGGHEQWINIRGKDRSNPVILFLHGGPGMPMMYLAHKFQRPLEEYFVCVQWDQRGAGKSYSKKVPVKTLTVRQILSDAFALIKHLRERLNKDKIYLVGHSWGTYIGMLLVKRHPELFHAFVSVGQVVDERRGREIADRFIKEQAQKNGNTKALDEMITNPDGFREKWLFAFGGELYGETSYMPFILAGLKSPEYGLFDIQKVAQGSSFSSQHMVYDAIKGTIFQNIHSVTVPVYFFTGRHDYTTPFELVELFFERLEAPRKKMIWFDNSAHFPFYEEPQQFTHKMLDIVLEESRKSEKY